MKSTTALVAAAAALLVANVPLAQSQQVCSKSYVSCMDTCATRQSKMLQGSCMAACQQKNDQCSEKIFGVRREPVGGAQQAGEARPDAGSALARQPAPVATQPQANAPRQNEIPAADRPAPRQPARK
jgi:hypothetical protein